ncbi:MAG: acyltransferase, partial [Cytophagaceae bacterium]
FFILSGFVMAKAYDGRFAKNLAPGAFLQARLRRLWPTMAVGIGLGAIVALLSGSGLFSTAGHVAAALTFVPDFTDPVGTYPLNGVQWSLALEIFANILHAVWLWRWTDRQLSIGLAIAGAALAVMGLFHGDLSVGHWGDVWAMGFVRVSFPYLMGMWLFRRWSRQETIERSPLTILILPLTLLVAGRAHGALLDVAVVIFALPAIVWICAGVRLSCRYGKLAGIVGLLSYPLYAFHLPLLRLAEWLGHDVDGQRGWAMQLIAIGLGCVLAALWAQTRPSMNYDKREPELAV